MSPGLNLRMCVVLTRLLYIKASELIKLYHTLKIAEKTSSEHDVLKKMPM